MKWNLDKKRPLCPQICEQICVWIANQTLKTGERLPSVRELALQAGVNPNTVQHSLESLEMQGILYSVRGSGWFVSDDAALAETTVKKLLRDKTATFFAEMQALGLDENQIKNYVKEFLL